MKQAPYFTQPQVQFAPDLQMPVAPAHEPSWLEVAGRVLLLFGAGYLLYKALETPKAKRRCSECGRTNHDARKCPYTGQRRNFPSEVVKTGWCECCGYWFAQTQLHHWGGRADDSRSMEMCIECHVHCGHNGHTQNFAIKPRYCRVA